MYSVSGYFAVESRISLRIILAWLAETSLQSDGEVTYVMSTVAPNPHLPYYSIQSLVSAGSYRPCRSLCLVGEVEV